MKNLGMVPAGTRWSRMFHREVEQQRMKIECDCGRQLILYFNQQNCNCGKRYNMSGQTLRTDAPSI